MILSRMKFFPPFALLSISPFNFAGVRTTANRTTATGTIANYDNCQL